MSYTYLTAETFIYPQCFSEFSKTYFLLSYTSIIAMGVTSLVTMVDKNKKKKKTFGIPFAMRDRRKSLIHKELRRFAPRPQSS